ncbi:hypothetical protein RAA17_04430 [Komagataeibacter rhaeticus]|nr:hypothetical protein [Komagataeibacter rhaeticus]
MRFAIGLLHADMRLAVRNIWSDGHTDDGPFPLPAHPVLAEADLAPPIRAAVQGDRAGAATTNNGVQETPC